MIRLARFIFVPVTIGWALAVFRYQLFNVERRWFKSALWLSGGVLVLISDVLFAYILDLKPLTALAAELFIAGLLYFPLHRRLMQMLMPEATRHLSDALPNFVASLQNAASEEDFQKAWWRSLVDHFQPLSIKNRQNIVYDCSCREAGLRLCVPAIASGNGFELRGKSRGNAPFSAQDVKDADSLLTLARAILHVFRARADAKREERTRIMRALHDNLGAKLLTMVHSSPDQATADHARDALQTLRATVHLSENTEPLPLTPLLADWRMETHERAALAGAELSWQATGIQRDTTINSDHALLLVSYLRETVSNALKHAKPSYIRVQIELASNQIEIEVANDYYLGEPVTCEPGFGVRSLMDRFDQAGGSLSFDGRAATSVNSQFVARAILPIEMQSTSIQRGESQGWGWDEHKIGDIWAPLPPAEE